MPQDGLKPTEPQKTTPCNGNFPRKIPWQIEFAVRRGEHISDNEREKCPGLWSLRQQHLESKRLKIQPEANNKPPSDPVLYKDKPPDDTPNSDGHDWP